MPQCPAECAERAACREGMNQWAKYVSPAGAYSSNNVIVTVTGLGNVSCRFSTIGFLGPNLLNRFHYHTKVCGTR